MEKLNYYEFAESIKQISLHHPFIDGFYIGRDQLNSKEKICYPALVYTFHSISMDPLLDNYRKTVSFELLYADRLTNDRSNTGQIHSVGIDVLDELFNVLNDCYYYYLFTGYDVFLFEDQFADLTAGAAATITMDIPTNFGGCDWLDIKKSVEMEFDFGYKASQVASSMVAGLIVSLESTVVFFIPALLMVAVDVYTAYQLSKRVKKKFPGHSDGKFKSSYIKRVLVTLIIIFIAMILGSYVDQLILRDMGQDYAVRGVMAAVVFYVGWSCLENWSSENDSPFAKACQRVMINKAERHLKVPLDDLFFKTGDRDRA